MERKILVAIVFIILSSSAFLPQYTDDAITPTDMRFMNFNLHFGVELNAGYDLGGFKEVIEDIKPVVVGFQEVTANHLINGFTNMMGDLTEMMLDLGYTYSYFQTGDRYYLRNAVFSQYEIIESITYDMQANNLYQRSILDITIKIGTSSAHVLITHLSHLPEDESGETKSGPKRTDQAMEFVNYALSLNTNNIIAMGDFNILDTWEEYNIITSYLVDAWNLTNPNSPGYTFPSHPDFDDTFDKRIDYIFVTPTMGATSCEVVDTIVSDHRPIYCDLTLA